jgi:hypothetical protein
VVQQYAGAWPEGQALHVSVTDLLTLDARPRRPTGNRSRLRS